MMRNRALKRVTRWWADKLPRAAELTILAFILIVAAFFRLYDLDVAVPVLFYDEAGNGLDALDILAGRPSLFFPRSFGKEPLFNYLVTPFVALLGRTILPLRLPAALLGTFTVLTTYLLVRELFRPDGERRSQQIALLTALFLAISYWHVTLSRLSFRANALPPLEALSFLFLWCGMRNQRPWCYVVSGLFLGLTLYAYIAARFVPLFLLLFSLVLLFTRIGRGVAFSWRSFLLLFLTALFVFTPLGLHFLFTPQDFFQRASLIWVHLELSRGEALRLLLKSALYNLGLFGFTGDKNWLYNVSGRPLLSPPLALLFWLGVLLSIKRWRKPRYLFLLLWFPIMVMPSIIALDPIPHSTRSCGTIPLTYIFPSLVIVEALDLDIRSRWLGILHSAIRILKPVSLSLVIALLSYTSYALYRDYFIFWAQREEVYWAFNGQITELAHRINEDDDPEVVYLFPINYGFKTLYGADFCDYTLDFLYQGKVPYHYLIVDEESLLPNLTAICRGKSKVRFIIWTHGSHIDADPRDLLPFIIEKHGWKVGEEAFRGYKILTYQFPSEEVTFTLPQETIRMEANFGDRLILQGYAQGPAFYEGRTAQAGTPSGEESWLLLRWRVKEPMTENYSVSITLKDQRGHVAGQADRPLMSNEHRYTSQWQVGQIVTTYHLLPSLPATPPGEYYIEVGVYEPQTMEGLVVLEEDLAPHGWTFSLGPLEIIKPLQPPTVEPSVEVTDAAADLAKGIRLLGYDLDRKGLSPGETLHLTLYWQTLDQVEEYTLLLQLRDAQGLIWAEQGEQPASGGWPTSRWEVGDLWRDWHDLAVAADVPSGEYHLTIALQKEGEIEGEIDLGVIKVEGRPRQFTPPPIEYPLIARLGESVKFLGYQLSAEAVKPGEGLHLTLYWQALAEMSTSYTVFTHLLDKDNHIWGQKDNVPGEGTLPTTGWLRGEIIVDEYEIVLRPETPAGEYMLEIGMYEAATGQRLPVVDARGDILGDRIIFGPIRVNR